jgi:hypothetical protein
MNKLKKISILSICLTISMLSNNINAQQRNNEKPIDLDTVVLKPDRLEELKRMADAKILEESLAYSESSEKDLKKLFKLIDNQERIISSKLDDIEKLYRTIKVDMSPQNSFKTIYLSPNYTTTILFIDKKGNPFSIEKFILGSSDNYKYELQSENMITFSPKVNVTNSNLTILFKDGKRPLAFNLLVNSEKVDYITEIQIDVLGNNSPRNKYTGLISTRKEGNPLEYLSKFEEAFMSEMLSNNLPQDFSEKYALNQSDEIVDDFRIFHKKDDKHLYIRTIHSIYSPEEEGVYHSADQKTKVIRIPITTSIVVNQDGILEQLKIK